MAKAEGQVKSFPHVDETGIESRRFPDLPGPAKRLIAQVYINAAKKERRKRRRFRARVKMGRGMPARAVGAVHEESTQRGTAPA